MHANAKIWHYAILLLNLAPTIAYIKFGAQNNIALEKIFWT